MSEFFRRVMFLLRRRKLERQLRDEMAFHREMMGEDARRFGNPLPLREEAREVWGWGWLDRLGQDLSFALRIFGKAPLLALTAIAVLGIGVGVNLTAFTLFDTFVLTPLPVRNADSLIRLERAAPHSHSTQVPYPAAVYYRDHCAALASVITFAHLAGAVGDGQNSVRALLVSANFFVELGSSAAYGRVLEPADEAPNAPPVVVLSYGYWQRQYGSDPSVVGKTIRINQHPATVAGVAAYDFSGVSPDRVDLWTPITQAPYFSPGTRLLTSYDGGVAMYAYLKPGVTTQAAEASLEPLVQEISRQHPDENWQGERLEAAPGAYLTDMDSNDVPLVALMSALVLLVLVIACGNLGNLLLAHTVAREREISIRFAMGATQGRIFRQMMSESVLLAGVGCVVGLALAMASARIMMSWLDTPVMVRLQPDWRIGVAAFCIGLFACTVFGVTPALKASRQSLRRTRARTVFIAAQIAASCVLLIVGGLLVRALRHATYSDPGFDTTRLLTLDPKLYSRGYTPEAAEPYLSDLTERLRQLPGVESVGLATNAPIGERVSIWTMHKPHEADTYTNRVDGGFLTSLGIPIVRGRNLQASDKNAVVLGEELARRLWPGESAVGKVLPYGEELSLTVVGVAANARTINVRDSTALEAYLSISPDALPEAVMVIRSSGDPAALVPAVRAVALTVNPSSMPAIGLVANAYREKLLASRRLTLVVGVMGGLALLLAVVGLYGVVSYNVSQRTKEFGIRMALGASPRQVAAAVAAHFVRPVGWALALGLAAAAALSVALRSQLYGLSNFDPATYVAACLLLTVVAVLAATWPVTRATHIDPAVTLRHE